MTRVISLIALGIVILAIGAGITASTIWLLWKTSLATTWAAEHPRFYDGFIGGLCGAVITAVLAVIAWVQLGGIAGTSSADFIIRLEQDFFTPEARRLIHLIERGWLRFEETPDGQDAMFLPDIEAIKASGLAPAIQSELFAKSAFSSYEIDDVLLGHFEDIGILERDRVMSFRQVYDEFSYYVETVWENQEIQKYVNWCRGDPGENDYQSDLWGEFERLYRKCAREGEQRLGFPSPWG